jgi:hypothetical protein
MPPIKSPCTLGGDMIHYDDEVNFPGIHCRLGNHFPDRLQFFDGLARQTGIAGSPASEYQTFRYHHI